MRLSSFDGPDTMPPDKQRRADPCLMVTVLTPLIRDGQPPHHRYDRTTARPRAPGTRQVRDRPGRCRPGSAGSGHSTTATLQMGIDTVPGARVVDPSSVGAVGRMGTAELQR